VWGVIADPVLPLLKLTLCVTAVLLFASKANIEDPSGADVETVVLLTTFDKVTVE